MLEELGIRVDVCHLNEGHAAFVILARALSVMERMSLTFPEALLATRTGNVFTTHTPVEAAFDRYEPNLIAPYARYFADRINFPMDQLLALGRQDSQNVHEPFNMAYLAMRGSGMVNGVSHLHGQVSRKIFQPLFPRWPESEVPVSHITNGVHVPSWDSPEADSLWTRICGKERWIGTLDELCPLITQIEDKELWEFRVSQRLALIQYIRRRLVRQLREHGALAHVIQQSRHVLDPNALTLGFARRFTAYKRPTLLLFDRTRLVQLLLDPQHPVQLIIAGKAHPHDAEGKRLVQTVARFAAEPALRDRVVFLEDYEMALAQELVAGIDVWLNTPLRPLEASGTSGMKVLVNGGLNLSELDGWWAEAFTPEVGWAIGDKMKDAISDRNALEAEQLYQNLEQQIIPDFFDRDENGIPRKWIARVRSSMSRLTPHFSSNRMMREYVEKAYLPAAQEFHHRIAKEAKLTKELTIWLQRLKEGWNELRFGDVHVAPSDEGFSVEVEVFLGDMDPSLIQVELIANSSKGGDPICIGMAKQGEMPGMVNAFFYQATIPKSPTPNHYTARLRPSHPEAKIPGEVQFILWQR